LIFETKVIITVIKIALQLSDQILEAHPMPCTSARAFVVWWWRRTP